MSIINFPRKLEGSSPGINTSAVVSIVNSGSGNLKSGGVCTSSLLHAVITVAKAERRILYKIIVFIVVFNLYSKGNPETLSGSGYMGIFHGVHFLRSRICGP